MSLNISGRLSALSEIARSLCIKASLPVLSCIEPTKEHSRYSVVALEYGILVKPGIILSGKFKRKRSIQSIVY